MIKRYSDRRIAELNELIAKYARWQKTELAVIEAREALKLIPEGTYHKIKEILDKNPIDVKYIDEAEKRLRHDLNAFLEERLRFLPLELALHFHKNMTSYDTEESGFVATLKDSAGIVLGDIGGIQPHIRNLAILYRYTPMNARTHGQEAEIQSFGKRCLTWYQDLQVATDSLEKAMENLGFSKLSGAIGTNSGIEPELEEAALKILGFKPWYGATQIMPRVLFAPLASAVADIACVMEKIADDVRLGARSGRPLWHEPFSKSQKGSSAMPHKKNTILTENTKGMARMARNYAAGLKENIATWEERDIAQSGVERVFWPDLFHVTLRAIQNMTKVMSGLVVYPDNMLLEIVESRGCYASNEAKETLLELGVPFGLTRKEAYRIVQLACFNAFEPGKSMRLLRENLPESLKSTDERLDFFRLEMQDSSDILPSIESIIANARLRVSDQLEADGETVAGWNEKLKLIFNPSFPDQWSGWNLIFKPSHILANEAHLFRKVFDV